MQIPDLEKRAAGGDAAAQVAWASVLDARGEHESAINWLARAAGVNHAPALRMLGIRLIIGLNAPGLPLQGCGLIREAGELGDGEALALLAAFAGIGYLQPQDWNVALGLLHAAAKNGWTKAQEDLLLLAAGPEGEVTSSPAVPGAGPGLTSWLQPPAAETLCSAPRVLSIPRMLPAGVCDALIKRSRGQLARAEVLDPVSGRAIIEKTRTNSLKTISLVESDLLNIVVQSRLAAAVSVSPRMLEMPSILNYQAGEAALDHFDFIDPSAPSYATEVQQRGQRIATILVYLNDHYERGETAFPEVPLSYRGRTGDALLFFNVDEHGAPDRRTVHAGLPPATGEKWIFSQFIRNRFQV